MEKPDQVDLRGILAQIIVGLIVALGLYPFYDIIVKDKGGWRNIFFALLLGLKDDDAPL